MRVGTLSPLRLVGLAALAPAINTVVSGQTQEASHAVNLLLNPRFEFHAFENHRLGKAVSYTSQNVAFWNCANWGDITVTREAHVDAAVRPAFSTGNLVSIQPGKGIWQFIALPEAGLAHGEKVSLHVFANQAEPRALKARITLLELDSEDGTWSPGDFGMGDKRTFPKHSRGELVVAKAYEAGSDKTGPVELALDAAEILGRFHDDDQSHSDDINTIGLRIEFENVSKAKPVWVWWPSLGRSATALARLPEGRPMVPMYRHIPRTMQKLWKGEPLHILVMGSSIDRGSANPPMYLYDEDPASPTFKQPLSDRAFEPERVGRPDLAGYVGWWQHYFGYSGRLRLELLRKFNLPVSKLLLNVMACDGSCVGEAHSGLEAYCSLALPPEENANGHVRGKTWQELYPELFSRPEGPRPDLLIFGSGANEKTDTPDEVAVFEGMIRWLQRRYPEIEFLFCQFQNTGGYTPNPGDLQALALRYQVPFLDYGKVGDDIGRWCNRYAFVPKDGHPQAASHFIWFTQLERAFECWDPVLPGITQRQLPERLHPNAYGWEGDMLTFDAKSPRLAAGATFLFEDTAINCWGDVDDGQLAPCVDGVKMDSRGKAPARDLRNSMFRHGRCRLGDRHVLELEGKGARLTFVDAKVCPDRRFLGVTSPLWRGRDPVKPVGFVSRFGAPYGSSQVLLPAGAWLEIDAVGTDVSVAYVDARDGGKLRVLADGAEKLVQPANLPFVDLAKAEQFIENRKGIPGLGFGEHVVRIEAVDGPVGVLGVFVYDSRPNRAAERRLVGRAAAGEVLTFSPAFRARPLVLCQGSLAVKREDVGPAGVTFSGQGDGTYEIVGE